MDDGKRTNFELRRSITHFDWPVSLLATPTYRRPRKRSGDAARCRVTEPNVVSLQAPP